MADQAAQWADVSDVNTLKTILAAQQAQLAQLQTQTPAQAAPAPTAAGTHSDRKRKAVKLHDDECSDFEDNDELGLDQGLQADDEEYDPTNDSDYEEPKKKKKQVHGAAAACRKHCRHMLTSKASSLAGPSCTQRSQLAEGYAQHTAQATPLPHWQALAGFWCLFI
jgi:hypothetical protein